MTDITEPPSEDTGTRGPIVRLTNKQMLAVFIICVVAAIALLWISKPLAYLFASLATAVGLFAFLGAFAAVTNRWGKFGGSAAIFVTTLILLLQTSDSAPNGTDSELMKWKAGVDRIAEHWSLEMTTAFNSTERVYFNERSLSTEERAGRLSQATLPIVRAWEGILSELAQNGVTFPPADRDAINLAIEGRVRKTGIRDSLIRLDLLRRTGTAPDQDWIDDVEYIVKKIKYMADKHIDMEYQRRLEG